MFDSFLMAFSLYSRIPVPQAKWSDRSMRYCICFLPLVGVVIGAAQYGLFRLLGILQAGPALRGALLAVLPVFLSGGIHMDGFLDTCDAIHSWKGPEERLRILKDPHVGAFALIGGLVYFVLAAGIWSETESAGPLQLLSLCLVFVLSRALSAFAALVFPKAKKDGMLVQETDPAAKGAAGVMAAVSVLTAAAMVITGGVRGACGAAACLAVLLYYRHTAASMFGGTTGDLAGWFLQLCELLGPAAMLLAQMIQYRLI